MPAPTFDVMKVEALRLKALELLRAAVAAANAPGAPASPFKDLRIPRHRFEKLDPKDAPFLHVVAKSDGGAGISHGLPEVDGLAVLHINLLCAAGRANAADLDTQAAQLTEAICLEVLEDQDFVAMFGWLEALRITCDDGVAKNDHGGEFDLVLVQIEIEVTSGPVRFEPRVPEEAEDLADVQVATKLGEDEASIPGQSLTVRATVPIEPDE